MDFSINTTSILSENCLLRVIADFNSEMKLRSAIASLGKSLNKKIVNEKDKNSIENISSMSITEDGVYHFTSAFFSYSEMRMIIINLLKWIKENGGTSDKYNFFVDIKLIDKKEGPFKGSMFFKGYSIESIDKLKFVLRFNEQHVFSNFPDRANSFISQSIKKIEPIQKFTGGYIVQEDPSRYKILNDSSSGVNFDTLSNGFLRMQYIGGAGYEDKINQILAVVHNFSSTVYDCIVDKSYSNDDLNIFKKLIDKYKKIQKAYKNYAVFKDEYPNIQFTINLLDNTKVLSQFYDILRDKIYDLISNLDFKISQKWFLNYDSLAQVLQIKGATLKCKNITGVEFIDCKLINGNFSLCDFYLSEVTNAKLQNCNVYRETVVKNSFLMDSFSNRTSTIENSEIDGVNSVTNSVVTGGLIRQTKVGKFAEISKETKVLKYEELKTGFIVAADKAIVKNPNKVKVN